ncbi:MAG: transposase [Verrucomicrobiales bacterium]
MPAKRQKRPVSKKSAADSVAGEETSADGVVATVTHSIEDQPAAAGEPVSWNQLAPPADVPLPFTESDPGSDSEGLGLEAHHNQDGGVGHSAATFEDLAAGVAQSTDERELEPPSIGLGDSAEAQSFEIEPPEWANPAEAAIDPATLVGEATPIEEPAASVSGEDDALDPRSLPAEPRINRTGEEFELNPLTSYQEEEQPKYRTAGEAERVREAVRQVVQEGRFVGDVARDMGLAPSSIYRWEKRYLDFISNQEEINRKEDWEDVYTWTGAPEIPDLWRLKFAENWDRLLEATHAEEADFRQDPLEIFLNNSMLTGWLFRDGRLDRNVALGAAVGLVLVLVLASFLRTKMKQHQTAGAKGPGVDTAELDKREISLASPVGLDYLRADGWEKKAMFVRDLKRVAPLMQEWYQKHSDAGQEDAELFYAMRSGDVVNVMVTFEKSGAEPAFLSLVKERGAYKVDWETSSGYHQQSWLDLVEKRPTTPFLLRCIIERGDYYNFDFMDSTKWRCFVMRYPRGPLTLYGYAERDSALGPRLDNLLEFKPYAGVVIEAVYPPGGRGKNQLRIVKLVHEAWLPESVLQNSAQ